MIELAKHIEILLLENDCVIVPGLGGFIVYYQPAYYDENEGVFYPPIRTVGFNPQLTMNDGLLTQAYMQTCHTDYSDALRKIALVVNDLKEMLYKDGFVEISGVGKLYYTIHDTYEFHPNGNGMKTPTLYALDSFLIYPISAESIEDPVNKIEKPVYQIKRKTVVHRDFQWFGNAIAVVVAVVLFFMLSVPVENTHIDKGVYASLGTNCLFDAIRTQSMATSLDYHSIEDNQKQKRDKVVPVVVKVEKIGPVSKVDSLSAKVKEAEVKNVETKKETPRKRVVNQPKKNYHIIVASLATSSDAQRMLQEYKRQGYMDASIKESKGRYRISICSYADKSIAYEKMNELKLSDSFKNAWMLTQK